MSLSQSWQNTVETGGEETLSRVGLDLGRVFDDPRITVWRDLPERQNCTLDVECPLGRERLHIKRYKAPHGPQVNQEVRAIGLLQEAGIDTVPLVAWGTNADGRAFLITRDLAGYAPADRVVMDAGAFEKQLPRLAELAARLHRQGLHHQDLYLCHFFVHETDATAAVRLIDPGRVARLPAGPWRVKWLVKDLAQFIYSMRGLGLPRELEQQFLNTYFAFGAPGPQWLIRAAIPLKVSAIARHDRRLQKKQPRRNVSLGR